MPTKLHHNAKVPGTPISQTAALPLDDGGNDTSTASASQAAPHVRPGDTKDCKSCRSHGTDGCDGQSPCNNCVTSGGGNCEYD